MLRNDYGNRGNGLALRNGLGGFWLFIVFSLLYLSLAHGAEYPTKTIQIINPHSPGGAAEVCARLTADKLTTVLGQRVIVVSKTGGGGTIGVQAAATAPADGYNLLISGPTFVVAPLVLKGIPFSPADFSPINLAVNIPSIIVVKKDAPWHTWEEFVADAKKNPGKLTYSTGGPGNRMHFDGELIKMATGINLKHIPMEGAGEANNAVLGGHISMTLIAYTAVLSYIEAGSLRALAMVSPKRIKEFPNVPTLAEKGYPQLTSYTWLAFFAPVKTPQAITKKLGEVFSKVLKDKEMIEKFDKAGLPIENLGPEETAKFIKEEQRRISEVLKDGKIEMK